MRRRAGVALALLLALQLGCASTTERADDAAGGSTWRMRGAPGEEFQALPGTGAWCWFADPRAVSHSGSTERTYVGWVDRSGRVRVCSIDHADGRVAASVLADFARPDDHANPALLVLPNGSIAAFYSDHGGEEILYRVSTRPEDVREWGEQNGLNPGGATGGYGFTYPSPFTLTGEGDRTYLFYRGRQRRPAYVTTTDFTSWSDEHTLLGGDVGDSYVKYASDGETAVHFAFTNGHPRGRPHNNIYYARYAGGVFERVDGSRICTESELPIAPADADLVYDAEATGARAWVWDIALDEAGHPVIAYAVFPRESEHRYRYAHWDGDAWCDSEIAFSGGWFPETPQGQPEKEVYYSAGLALDHVDPSIVYLSRRVRGVYEIERWVTFDRGREWHSESVTSGSATNNVRPVVPSRRTDNGPQLLWMSGHYKSYTDFRTSIRFASFEPVVH